MMTYYRLAFQDRQTTTWTWKTTAVTSLQAVFQLLRGYSMLPQDTIRVFTASSKEELNEMLSRQNNHLASSSVTAAQFLQERHIAGGEQAQSISDQRVSAQTVQQATDVVAWATWEMHKAAQMAKQGTDNATMAKESGEKQRAGQETRQEVNGVAASPLHEHLTAMGAPSSLGLSLLDTKRLELERGQGGDHDTPYRFTLPISVKEQLFWVSLQAQVWAGELSS
jgi:hypothetical protein